MKQFKRWTSMLLSLCMLLTMTAIPAAATTEPDIAPAVEEDSPSSPLHTEETASLLSDTLSSEVTEWASGTCGAGVTWVATSDGVLTISGTGDMDNYTNQSHAPWFNLRNKIQHIVIEDGVTSIGDYAFPHANGLHWENPVTLPDSIVSIGDYAFAWASNIRTMAWPANLTSIGEYAFSSCGLNSDLVLPDTLTSLGKAAFMSNDIANLTVPGTLKEIPEGAFSGNDLRTLVLHNGVTTIGKSAFSGSTYLGDQSPLSLPESVTTIGEHAFSGCGNLTSVYIPATITSLHETSFAGCTRLAAIHVSEDSEHYASVEGILYNAAKTELLMVPAAYSYQSVEIPDTVTAIKDTLLFGNPYVLHLSLPAAMTELDFMNLPQNLLTLRIPGTVTQLNRYLLGSKICHVYYGGSEAEWNALWSNGEDVYSAFDGTVHFDGTGHYRNDIAGYPATGGDIYIDLETGTVVHCDKETKEIDIPAAIDDITITGIGPSAFSMNYSLERVSLPDTLTHIGDEAFWDTNISSIDLPDGLTTIGSEAFGCTDITSVTVPGSVVVLDKSAFAQVNYLKEVVLENGVTEIGDSAFDFCYALTSISIPESVALVGDFAFNQCSNLTTISFPGDQIQFGLKVFEGCDNLKNLYFAGTAPKVYALHTSWPSFPRGATLHCVEQKSGWTDSSAYDWYGETWNGWPLVVQEDVTLNRFIVPLQPDGITINGKGNAFPHFRLTDYFGDPLANEAVVYTLDGGEEQKDYTDGNGIFSVPIHDCKTGEYTVAISLPDFEDTLYDSTQTVPVTVTQPSYSQTWSGSVGAGVSVGIGGGAGVSVGVASASATLASADANMGLGATMEISSEVADGSQTLGVKYSESLDGGFGFKSGVEATLPHQKFELASASAGVTGGATVTHGLRIENFDPENQEQALQLAQFLLQMALQNRTSVLDRQIMEQLEVDFHNLTGWDLHIFLDSGASVLGVESTGSNRNLCSLAGADASYAYSTGIEENHLNNTVTRFFNAQQDLSAGTLQGLNSSDNPWGDRGSNALELSMAFDQDEHLNELAYRVYENGKQDIIWGADTVDTFRDYTYGAGAAAMILDENPVLKEYAEGNLLLLDPLDVGEAQQKTARSEYTSTYSDHRNVKSGGSLDFPFEVSFIAGGGISLSGDLVDEFSYTTKSGLWKDNTEYQTAESTMATYEMESYQTNLVSLLANALVVAGNFLYDLFEEHFGQLVEGVETVYSTVSGTVEDWYISVKTAAAGNTQSYAIFSLMSEAEPVSNAAVSATIGDPHGVTVYTDSTMETLVSDEALEAAPLTLTLSYTDDMLEAAGASADDDISIYRFDPERNVYIYLPGCVQDKANQTVTASITRNGEYILATDSASPLVSDFTTSNLTATPTITALVSDLSGLSDFRFWLDDGETLVDMGSLNDHYNPATNLFAYQVTAPLASGEHTAYFQTVDALGNANSEPFAFTFTVDAEAPVIANVTVPTETVTNPDGFTVSANVTDNDSLSQVLLHVQSGKETYTIPMTGNDSLWSADVTGIAGLSSATVTVLATDKAGNRAESDAAVVTIDVPAASQGIVLSGTWNGSAADVTVKNEQVSAIGGWLLAVAYDEDGKMLDTAGDRIALLGQDEAELRLTFSNLTAQPAICKLFLLSNGNTFRPLCSTTLVQ